MFTSPCGEDWWLVWQKTLASPFLTCVDLHVRASFSTNLKFVDSMNFLSSLAFKNGCKPLQATSWKHLETEIYGFQRRRPWPAGIAPAKCYTATHAYSCKHMTHTRSQYDSICSKAVLFMTNLCLEVFGLHKWLHDRLDSLMPFLWPVTSLLQHVDLLWVPNHLGCWRQREAPRDVQIRVISLTRWNTCRLADANRVKILQASAELDKEVAVGLVVSSLSWLRHQSGTSAKCIFPSLHLTCLQPSVPRHHKLSKPLAASWARNQMLWKGGWIEFSFVQVARTSQVLSAVYPWAKLLPQARFLHAWTWNFGTFHFENRDPRVFIQCWLCIRTCSLLCTFPGLADVDRHYQVFSTWSLSHPPCHVLDTTKLPATVKLPGFPPNEVHRATPTANWFSGFKSAPMKAHVTMNISLQA